MDLKKLQEVMDQGRLAAKDKPGRYGGRYLARYYDKSARADVFVVLSNDDPELEYLIKGLRRSDLDIFAQATPDKVFGMGAARNWFDASRTKVDHKYFNMCK